MTAADADNRFYAMLESAILHGLLIFILFLIGTFQPPAREGSSTIQFDSISDKKAERQMRRPHSRGQTEKFSQRVPTPKAVSLADLGVKFNAERLTSTAPEENTPESQDLVSDGWDLTNPDPRVARFNQYIFNTVQGWLNREGAQDIHGTVKVRIWFDENGNYLENETLFEYQDPNFRRIVARALRNSFINPIPKPYLFMNKKFCIDRIVVIRGFS